VQNVRPHEDVPVRVAEHQHERRDRSRRGDPRRRLETLVQGHHALVEATDVRNPLVASRRTQEVEDRLEKEPGVSGLGEASGRFLVAVVQEVAGSVQQRLCEIARLLDGSSVLESRGEIVDISGRLPTLGDLHLVVSFLAHEAVGRAIATVVPGEQADRAPEARLVEGDRTGIKSVVQDPPEVVGLETSGLAETLIQREKQPVSSHGQIRDGLLGHTESPQESGHIIANRRLLAAIWRLAWLRPEGQPLTRVNWRDMQTEELGSVYEGLLELTPRASAATRTFAFAEGDETRGHERKKTGSYYTPEALVKLLLDATLDPVLDAAEARNPADPIAGILRLAILDPACGSGHFLLGSARRAAARIAKLRSPGAPSSAEFQHALREVVSR
jgi:hypothetical protein